MRRNLVEEATLVGAEGGQRIGAGEALRQEVAREIEVFAGRKDSVEVPLRAERRAEGGFICGALFHGLPCPTAAIRNGLPKRMLRQAVKRFQLAPWRTASLANPWAAERERRRRPPVAARKLRLVGDSAVVDAIRE